MAQIFLKVGYRPVKIGWCVPFGDIDALRNAVRLTSTMWGGRYNPIIPIGDGDDTRTELVSAFAVDGLFSVTDDTRSREFATSFDYLRWPLDWDDLFIDDEKVATVLDIYHPFVQLNDMHNAGVRHDRHGRALWIDWDETDPLRNVFACTFGEFPPADVTGRDYQSLFKKWLSPDITNLTSEETVPSDIMESEHISSVSCLELNSVASWQYKNLWMYRPGIFIGSADNFTDLVSFWNLRASNIDLVFFDPRYADRSSELCNEWLRKASIGVANGFADDPIVWLGAGMETGNAALFSDFQKTFIHASTDLIADKTVIPLRMSFGESTIIGAIDETSDENQLLIQTPEPPFYRGSRFHFQNVAVTVRFTTDLPRSSEFHFRVPHLPELNEFVGRKCSDLYWKKCRIQPDGLDFIQHVSTEILYVSPIEQKELFSKVFEIFGITAKQSPPGRTTSRIIRHMGGLQGCRIFKIAGVRKLIRSHGPTDSFTRSHASKLISNRDENNKIHFEAYEDLMIGQGRQKLTHDFVFKKLLETDVFLVGLNLICPICEMEFWLSMDALKRNVPCEYCAHSFSVTTQLKDRDWAYRTSGLFAKSTKDGAVPVVVTLQQLDFQIGFQMLGGWGLFTTSMELSGANIRNCESDFLGIGMDHNYQQFLVIGECKTNSEDEITDDDIDKLSQLANAIPSTRLKTYILFSKTGEFSEEEILRCKRAQIQEYARVIILSARELEPLDVYENSPEEMQLDKVHVSLNSMAGATRVLFFKSHQTLKMVPKDYQTDIYFGETATTTVRDNEQQTTHNPEST